MAGTHATGSSWGDFEASPIIPRDWVKVIINQHRYWIPIYLFITPRLNWVSALVPSSNLKKTRLGWYFFLFSFIPSPYHPITCIICSILPIPVPHSFPFLSFTSLLPSLPPPYSPYQRCVLYHLCVLCPIPTYTHTRLYAWPLNSSPSHTSTFILSHANLHYKFINNQPATRCFSTQLKYPLLTHPYQFVYYTESYIYLFRGRGFDGWVCLPW